MGKTKKTRPSLSGLFDKVLETLETEIASLPEILQGVSPERRLDFISKNLPLLLKYRESGQGDPEQMWVEKWGN